MKKSVLVLGLAALFLTSCGEKKKEEVKKEVETTVETVKEEVIWRRDLMLNNINHVIKNLLVILPPLVVVALWQFRQLNLKQTVSTLPWLQMTSRPSKLPVRMRGIGIQCRNLCKNR